MASLPLPSPYKFLDSYTAEDAAIFFGRETETELLLSDVVLSRLVVLFAKTGTGKTSLINAAVRPELHRRGFGTFFVRVRKDPAASLRDELMRDSEIATLDGTTLAAQLAGVVKALDRPIVVFFDQFEEFFLFLAREQPEQARDFVSDLATLYRERESAVHVVLSMREDFYVELDSFRDDIPTIFQRESNLRLRWFAPEKARDAITKPLELAHVEIEPKLVDWLIEELCRRQGLAEPAQLQIVCDTLWRGRENGAITLSQYLSLGSADDSSTIAEQIVGRRLAEQFEKFGTRDELELIEALLAPGVLSTDRGTKYVRDLPGLERELSEPLSRLGGPAELRRVVNMLEESRLVRLYARDGLDHIELTHDYLVSEPERLAELRRSVRAIWPRRVLAAGRGAWDSKRQVFEGPTTDLEDVLTRVADEHEEAKRRGTTSPDSLSLTSDDAAVLLHLALHLGLHALLIYEVALEQGAPAREIVIETVRGPNVDDATFAVGLLGQLGDSDAVNALAEVLGDERFAAEAQRALTEIAQESADTGAAEIATEALTASVERALDDPELAQLALQDLGRLEAERSVEVLVHALADPALADSAELALRRLARSQKVAIADRAQRALAQRETPPAPSPSPPPSPAPRRSRPSPLAGPALKRRVATTSGVDESHYNFVATTLLGRGVIFVLGPGANVVGRPADATWKRGAPFLPSLHELARDMSYRFGLTEVLPELARVAESAEALLDLPFVAQFAETFLDKYETYGYLRAILADRDYVPTQLHRFVAQVPHMLRERGAGGTGQLVLTTNWDDTLERAFDEQGEPYDVIWPDANGRGERRGLFLHRPPSGEIRAIDKPSSYSGLDPLERPVIVKLLGTVDRRTEQGDSFLVSEDDLFDFSLEQLPALVASRLMRSSVLHLGFGIGSWGERVVLRRTFTRSDYRSWAVAYEPNRLDEHLWSRRDVELVSADLGEYVAELDAHVRRLR